MTGTTTPRSNGTFAAKFNDIECRHQHGSVKAATACLDWESKTFARKGTSAWAEESAKPRGTKTLPKFTPLVTDDDAPVASMEHEYIPAKELVALWSAMMAGVATKPAGNLLFIGPSGSGKTDGARYLAGLAGLPFTKVDAASMTDPESWFGTRELAVEDGVSVTRYEPSAFVTALQLPGFILIDEITRVRDEHRNVLLPLLDHTRAVLNPLTGDVIERHPQCFIAMAGNVGINFTGTNAVDPAFWTRARTVEFDYLAEKDEISVVQAASACDADTAFVLVRFAAETRAKAVLDDEFRPVSTREIIEAGRDCHDGLDRDLAVKFNILNANSSEGGTSSVRTELQALWNGVRTLKAEPTPKVAPAGTPAPSSSQWMCATHGVGKTVAAGVSSRTGKSYATFRSCPITGCQNTEDRVGVTRTSTVGGPTRNNPNRPATTGSQRGSLLTCTACGTVAQPGRTTICAQCGSTL